MSTLTAKVDISLLFYLLGIHFSVWVWKVVSHDNPIYGLSCPRTRNTQAALVGERTGNSQIQYALGTSEEDAHILCPIYMLCHLEGKKGLNKVWVI